MPVEHPQPFRVLLAALDGAELLGDAVGGAILACRAGQQAVGAFDGDARPARAAECLLLAAQRLGLGLVVQLGS